MKIQWLGAAGLFIKSSDKQGDILIDPYVSGETINHFNYKERQSIQNRIVDNPEFSNVKMLVGTHDHFDHTEDIPYIWSKWCSGTSPRKDVSIVTIDKTIANWEKNCRWKNSITAWSKGKHQEFLNHTISLTAQGETNTVDPIIKAKDSAYQGTTIVDDSNSIVLGNLKLTFIRHFHSDIPILPFDEQANDSGVYGLYIEDINEKNLTDTKVVGTVKGEEPLSVNCKNAYISFSLGLPYNPKCEDLRKYEDYEFSDSFISKDFTPDWIFLAISKLSTHKHEDNLDKQEHIYSKFLEGFNCLKTQDGKTEVKGMTPIHWDKHMATGPRFIGRQGNRRVRKVKQVGNHLKRIVNSDISYNSLPNISFGIKPSRYSIEYSYIHSL